MQRVFRNHMFHKGPTPSYKERIRRFNEQLETPGEISALQLLREFSAGNVIALEHLAHEASSNGEFTRAINAIDKAATVYIIDMRRSFAVAAYLFYTLRERSCSTVSLECRRSSRTKFHETLC